MDAFEYIVDQKQKMIKTPNRLLIGFHEVFTAGKTEDKHT